MLLGLVGLAQFVQEHLHRPAIGDNVVHRQQQHPVLDTQPQQAQAPQRPSHEIEGAVDLCASQPAQFALALLRGQPAQIEMQQRRAADRE